MKDRPGEARGRAASAARPAPALRRDDPERYCNAASSPCSRAPSDGAVRDQDLLLEYVAERNRTLALRMHCISLAGDAQCRDFLKRLSALGGGGYVEAAPDK